MVCRKLSGICGLWNSRTEYSSDAEASLTGLAAMAPESGFILLGLLMFYWRPCSVACQFRHNIVVVVVEVVWP